MTFPLDRQALFRISLYTITAVKGMATKMTKGSMLPRNIFRNSMRSPFAFFHITMLFSRRDYLTAAKAFLG
jgi:hypothetical protein